MKWTYLTIPVLAVISVTAYLDHASHVHHDPMKFPYLRIRNKQFFFGLYECHDCTFLDMDCRRKCSAALREAEEAQRLAEEHEKEADEKAEEAPKH